MQVAIAAYIKMITSIAKENIWTFTVTHTLTHIWLLLETYAGTHLQVQVRFSEYMNFDLIRQP